MTPLPRSLAALLLLVAMPVALAQAPAPAPAPAKPKSAYQQEFDAARALAKAGKRQQAIEAYTKLLEKSPGNSDVLLARGTVYSWLKRWPEAEADLSAVVSAHPGYVSAWSVLGDMYLRSGRPGEAVTAYGQWVALKPKSPNARLARGQAHQAANDLAAARADYEAARGLGASPKQVKTLLASLEPGPAKAPGGTAAAPAGSSFDADFKAARALATQGRREEAIQAYTRLLERSPGNADVLLARGQVYAWEKRWPEAEGDLRAATAAKPNYPAAWSALGDMYLWSKRPREAADAYGRWIELKPNDADARLARGRAYREANDAAAARADFEAARGLGADAKEVDKQLASLERRGTPDAVVAEGFHWTASLGVDWESFSPARAEWTEYDAKIRRHYDSGSLGLELLEAHRFDQTGRAWALDAYQDLWSRAYMNTRYQQDFDDRLYPDHLYRVELFQGVGQGWELSAGYDRMEFKTSEVDIYSIGVGKYIGSFYYRWKHLFTSSTNSEGNSDQLLARWYYAGNDDDYLELRAGAGRSTQEPSGSITSGAPESSSSASLTWMKWYTRHTGLKLGASYGDDAGDYVSHGLRATLHWRW